MQVAKPIASWLTVRTQNTIFGLLASLVLPPTPFLGAAVMSFLLLHEVRLQKIALLALIAVGFMAALNTAFGSSPLGVLQLAAVTWLPAAAFGLHLRRSRSLTLTLQVSVMVMIGLVSAVFLLQADNPEFGRNLVTQVADVLRESGYALQADQLEARHEVVAWQLMSFIALLLWSSFALALATGNALYNSQQEEARPFGTFDRLNFGRVLAIGVAVLCVFGLTVSALWLKSLAFVAFLVFWIQGLAILHWLNVNRGLPKAVVIATYVALPFLNLFLAVVLAVAGYLDAWFDWRKRWTAASAS